MAFRQNTHEHKSQCIKKNDLDHWASLDKVSGLKEIRTATGTSITGSMVREQALEWLRLESIRLAVSNASKVWLQIAKGNDLDIKSAHGTHRDSLITLPPCQVSWNYPYTLKPIGQAFCFEVLKPANAYLEDLHLMKLQRSSQFGRVVISIDPEQSADVIVAAFRGYLKDIRKKNLRRKAQRAPGAGRPYRLVKLREALLSYETWLRKAPIKSPKTYGPQAFNPSLARDNVTIRIIGENLKHFGKKCDSPDILEKRGQEALKLARKMLTTAALEPTSNWPIKFRVVT